MLLAADANGFASLTLLNSKWRATSQRPHLYAHHLSRCPSYAVSGAAMPHADDRQLPLLRRLFAREVKRSLFEAYLRPKKTLIKLVSNSISSSSCPGGEGMSFAFSPAAQHVLAYNSARIYLIDARGPAIDVKREFKILRRPLSVCITEDARTLAVLSTEMQVDVYDLRQTPPQRRSSLILDNSPRNIALSACGTVLAAAYDGGIEVSALSPTASSAENRAVKCDAVDALAFSRDGTQILGTTIHSSPPSTVILTAPYYDPGSQMMDDNLSAMWTNSILFPNSSRDCSHAIWLPDGESGEPEWTFTYDRSFETFRAVRLDDLRNGTTHFTGPVPKPTSQAKLLPCTLPATTLRGDLVSAGFENNDVWMYGVPENLTAVPEAPPASHETPLSYPMVGASSSTRHTSPGPPDGGDGERVPQWQILCDKVRNNLVPGIKIAGLHGVSSARWLSGSEASCLRERLVLTAPGVMGPRLVTDKEDMDFVDGGRIMLLDFDYRSADGEAVEMTIEVGTDQAEPLTEERRDIETEVAIVRRRTVAQGRGGSGALLRAATTAAPRAHVPGLATSTLDHEPSDPSPVDQKLACEAASPPDPEAGEAFVSMEEQEALDGPYAHSSPRSRTTLRRAATAAAVNRRLNPRTADGRPIEYRRADGRAEHPHESDADNWVPPPPPYQREDPGDLPDFMRGPSVPPMPVGNPSHPASGGMMGERYFDTEGSTLQQPVQVTSNPIQYRNPRHQRTASDSISISRIRTASGALRPRSTPSVHSIPVDDLYDVSPQESPRLSVAHLAEPAETQSATNPLSASSGRPSPDNISGVTPTMSATNRSSVNLATVPASPRSSAGPASRPAAPQLELRIPSTPSMSSRSNSEAHSEARRLSTAQTWPRQPQSEALAQAAMQTQSARPYHTPPTSAVLHDVPSTALPPAPSSSQIASLNKRISQGNPRRLSGNMLNSRFWVDKRSSMMEPASARQSSTPPLARRLSATQIPDSDRPLIISTPTGITGTYDAPTRRASLVREETPILAPVPHRPQPNFPAPGGTAAQLQDIYGNQPAPAPLPPHMRAGANALPLWMRTPSTSSRRTPSGVNRRRSRAERSAAKNMKDAKLKGWRSRKKNKQSAPADGSGWVDVPATAQPKTSRCSVM